MKHLLAVLFLFLWTQLDGQALTQPSNWTIMIYMNAKNDLEPAALEDFLTIAKTGSSEQVQIVVELGRPEKTRNTTAEDNWTGVLRFHVLRGMEPLPESAVEPTGGSYRHADMASGRTLADFTSWATKTYPAQHTMLLIWSHGQGYRVFLNVFKANQSASPNNALNQESAASSGEISSSTDTPTGFKAVSYDSDTQHMMFNRDIQDSLAGQHVDILGFDACLMQMIESAYAFRDVAHFMVASEDLIPEAGWRYDLLISQLVGTPDVEPDSLASLIVNTYATPPNPGLRNLRTTLSSIDLTAVASVAKQISSLSRVIMTRLPAEASALTRARSASLNYGDVLQSSWLNCEGSKVLNVHSIDLSKFLSTYAATTKDAVVSQEIGALEQSVKALVTHQVATPRSQQLYGSWGLAIYFPGSSADYRCDPSGEGYDVDAVRAGKVSYPPEFVEKELWGDFLKAYLVAVPNAPRDR